MTGPPGGRPRGSRAPHGTTETAEALGLTPRQLDHWAAKGYLHPESPGRRGAPRVWPEAELRIAGLMARLAAAGLEMSAAATAARAFVAFRIDQIELGEGIVLRVTPVDR